MTYLRFGCVYWTHILKTAERIGSFVLATHSIHRPIQPYIMAVEFRGGEQKDYGDRNIQYGGSRSARRQEKLPPGGIHGTRWADLDADVDDTPVRRQRPKKEEYGANKLPDIESLQELNSLDLKVVRQLVKSGKLDDLITDINDLKGLHSNVLQIMFQHGHDPDPSRFSGQMRGVDLHAPHHDESAFGGFIDGAMRLLQAWGGKQTKSRPSEGVEGTGNNQMFLCIPNLWFFEFNWDLVDSKLGDKFAGDGGKVIRLDYNAPNNALNQALGVDMVHDEIREIGKKGSGVNLGMAAIIDSSDAKAKRKEGGLLHQAYAAVANGFWKSVYDFGLTLGGREERVGSVWTSAENLVRSLLGKETKKESTDPIEFVYFALQSSK